MQTLHCIASLREAVAAARSAGRAPVALVPTMGNLHAGHMALVRSAAARSGCVVASIFVNPLQFGPGEDYGDYPRTLDRDAEMLADAGVDLLFAPDENQMYPHGKTAAQVAVSGLSDLLCGAHRPGHFLGVTTVVTMLLNQVGPDLAVFGEKDYQQLVVIRRMVADLHFPVQVLGVPTVREADGLAMSSRNQYLTAGERRRAPGLYAALRAAAKRLESSDSELAIIEAEGRRRLAAAGIEPEYFEVRADDLARPGPATRGHRVLAAGRLGCARLIDNLPVGERAANGQRGSD